MTEEWTKRIRVDKDIVTLLSRRTYDNFPQAIREVVSNAYDADSTLVEIGINERLDQINIIDNGCGMSPDDFDYYLRIAAMTREATVTSRLGRRRIGHFGIGFLSMFPFCKSIEITSTTENSDVVFSARINAQAYTDTSARRVDVGDIEVHGNQRRDAALRRTHGTTFTLVGLTDLVTQYFQERTDASRKSIQSWYWPARLRWELEQILPLEHRASSPLCSAFDGYLDKPMEVRLNGQKLYRNDIEDAQILEISSVPIVIGESGVRVMYALMSPRTTVSPVEARGLQLRLRNVGVGNPTYFGLNITGRLYGKLVWIAGEVHILDGLDHDISIDRNSFTWSARYEALSDFFVEMLRDWAERLEAEHYALRDIGDFLDGDMHRAPVVPVRDAIQTRIDTLRELDYRVVESAEMPPGEATPVHIDTSERVVTYYVNHPELHDAITVAGRTFDVQYDNWPYQSSDTPACKIEQGKVVFNQRYPLFQNPRHKRFCEKLAILLEIGKSRYTAVSELEGFLLRQLVDEIRDD